MATREKLPRPDASLEETLEALLEIIGWQAELVRAALKQVRGGGATRRRGRKPPKRR